MGAFAAGPLSDRFGRKLVYLGSLGLSGASGLVAALSPAIEAWMAARAVCGAAVMAMNLAANVYFIEIVGGKVVGSHSFRLL